MNILITKFIEPTLPKSKKDNRRSLISSKYFCKYDTRKLVIKDAQFFTVDFVFKFIKMNGRDCKSLEFCDVYTQHNYSALINYLNQPNSVHLEQLILDNIFVAN